MSEETLEHSEEKEEQKLPSKHIDKEELSDFAALLSELPDEAAPILEGLPDKERRIITRAMVQMSVRRSWEGPLPDPETLRGYNGCFEGGAKAVFDLTKDQSDHRKKLETTVVNRELNQSGRGQNYAFILALVLMDYLGFLPILEKLL